MPADCAQGLGSFLHSISDHCSDQTKCVGSMALALLLAALLLAVMLVLTPTFTSSTPHIRDFASWRRATVIFVYLVGTHEFWGCVSGIVATPQGNLRGEPTQPLVLVVTSNRIATTEASQKESANLSLRSCATKTLLSPRQLLCGSGEEKIHVRLAGPRA